MIAIDSSVLVDYLLNRNTKATDRLHKELLAETVCLPPVVMTEIMSNPSGAGGVLEQVVGMYVLTIDDEYWYRAGCLRAAILRKGFKSNLGDALIAQSCIDNQVPLLTMDKDFRHYAKHAKLELVTL